MNSDMDVLNMVHDSLEAGGHGVSIGRNIFQHKDVKGMMSAVSDIVIRGATVEEAAKHLRK